jgi:hypothetical protein
MLEVKRGELSKAEDSGEILENKKDRILLQRAKEQERTEKFMRN